MCLSWNSDGANRILAWDRTSHGCCVLCWGRLDAILFSLSLFPHSSLHLSLRQSSFCPPHLSPSFLPSFHFSFSCFFLLICSMYLSSPSFSALFLPSFPLLSSSFSRARTRRAFRKRLSHVHAGVCIERARICVGLYCVRWKVRRGNRWMRAYVSRIIRVYVRVRVRAIRGSFPCEIKTDRFIVIIVTHAGPLICVSLIRH